jgi:hypothetical protein
MKLGDSLDNRLLVKQARAFVVLMLVAWAVVALVSAFVLLGNSQLDAPTKLLVFLNAQLLLLVVFVIGQLFLLAGIFWWEKIEFVKK